MNFLIEAANAAPQAAPQQSPLGMLPMLIIFGLVFYFLLIRPQQKKQKQHAALVAGLKEGDEVLTAGGILGKIKGVSEHYVIVQIADATELKMQKASISQVVPNGTFDNA